MKIFFYHLFLYLAFISSSCSNISVPVDGRVMSSGELGVLINTKLAETGYSTAVQYSFNDSQYIVLNSESFMRLIVEYEKPREYQSESFDCDDYSEYFKSTAIEMASTSKEAGIAIGIVIVEIMFPYYHGMNIIPVYDEKKNKYNVVLFEPQLGEVYSLREYRKDNPFSRIIKISF